ncbi:MAG: tetratricopeptide repeat protein [Thermoanaerobaculia bacterium]
MKAAKRHDLIHLAEVLAGRGKLRKALALYLQVLKAGADDPKLLNRAGDLCVRLQKSSDAITFYKRAASVLHRQGFYPQAAALCRKILKLDPRLIDVIEALADLLAKQGLTAEAVNQYEALAQYYRNPKKAGAAIRILGRIVELQPASLPHRLELAALLGQEGRAGEAHAQYRSAASSALARGQAAAARKALVHAFELAPDDLDLVADGIDRLRQSGFAEEAEKLLEAALELTPRTEALTQRLAVSPTRPVEESGQITNSPAPAAEAASIDPTEWPVSRQPEVSAEPMAPGTSPEADDEFVDLAGELEAELAADEVAWGSGEPEAWNGSSQDPIGEGSSPTVCSEHLDPKEIETHYQLGLAYKEMALIDEAVGELQAAARLPDYVVRCSMHLADCFVEKGVPRLAVQWLERALTLPSLSGGEADILRGRLAELEAPADETRGRPAQSSEELELDHETLEVPARLPEDERT